MIEPVAERDADPAPPHDPVEVAPPEAPAAQPQGKSLTIGAVCKALSQEFPDISISKIRYLEDQKLLTPRRTPGGYRLYSANDVSRLRTILRLQRDEFLPLRVIRQELAAGRMEGELAQPGAPGDARPGAALRRLAGVEVSRTDWDLSRVPDHLRMTFRIEDDDGRVVGEGKDLDALRRTLAPQAEREVAEAAAVAAPDPERGSVVKAVIVTSGREPSDELARELQEHVKEQTAPYKYPRIVEFADSLPKTTTMIPSGHNTKPTAAPQV